MAEPIRLPPAEAYERWALSYDHSPNPLLALEERCVRPLLPDVADKVVLDVACGTGHRLQSVISAGARGVGSDLARSMLLRAVSKPNVNGRCAQGDALRLPFPNGAADLVLCSFLVGYVRNLSALLAELGRVARNGGSLLLSELHPDAVHAGWHRTFRAGDQVYEPEHIPHSIESVRAAASWAGLDSFAVTEHAFAEPERAVFNEAGKSNFDLLKGRPALWIGVGQLSG